MRWIVQERGLKVYRNSGLINALLSDLTKDDSDSVKKVKLAMMAGAGGHFYSIINAQGTMTDAGREKFVHELTKEGFSSEFCSFILELFEYSVSEGTTEKSYLSRNPQPQQKKDSDHQSAHHVSKNADGSVTEGEMIDGVWNGPFKKTYPSGASFEGTYNNGICVGKLIYSDKDGNVLICNWEQGNWNGRGEYKSKEGVLKAVWENGKVVGDAEYLYSDGSKYVGGIRNYKKQGKGRIYFTNSAILAANFDNDHTIGNAEITYQDGSCYVGNWLGSISGRGVFTSRTCPNILYLSYDGFWKDGKMTGQGKLIVEEKNMTKFEYVGSFQNGSTSGYGTLKMVQDDEEEVIYIGSWRDNSFTVKTTSKIQNEAKKLLSQAIQFIKTTIKLN